MRRGGSSWVKDPQQLGTAVGLKRAPRIVGKTERIGRPRPAADLDHDLRNVRPPGDLPAPAARTGTGAHVPAQVRTDLPAHQCETTTTHAAPGEPGRTTPARPWPSRAAPRAPGAAPRGLAPDRITFSDSPGRRRAQVAVLAQRGGRDLGNAGPADVGDLRGRTSDRGCGYGPQHRPGQDPARERVEQFRPVDRETSPLNGCGGVSAQVASGIKRDDSGVRWSCQRARLPQPCAGRRDIPR